MSRVERLARAARGAAARHQPRQRPLPDRARRARTRPLLVEPDGNATLFTDFRYAQKAARRSRGSSVVQTARDRGRGSLDRAVRAAIGFEAARRRTRGANEQLRGGGVDLVAAAGLVEGLRAVKEPEELAADRARRGASPTRSTRRSPRSSSPAAPSASSPGAIARAFHEHGAAGLAFDTIVAAGRERRQPARRRRATPMIPARHARHGRRRLPWSTATLRLHAHVRDRRAAGRARARVRGLPRGAACGSRRGTDPARAGGTPTPPRAT